MGKCNQAIIGGYYSNLVLKGLIKPLEGMDKDYRDEVKKMVLEYSNPKTDFNSLFNLAKLIHIIAHV